MKRNLSLIYEKFYKGIKLQKRIIGRKNFTYRLILDVLEPNLTKGKQVLDIGCGAGTLSFYIASKGCYVNGIDISLKAIEACRLNAKKLNVEKNTKFQAAEFLEVEINRKFDLILCNEVLEHLINDNLAIEKIFSSLKIGGIAIITVPLQNAPLFRWGFMKKFDRSVGHLRRYNTDQLINLIKKKNFEIIEEKRIEGVFRNFLFTSRFGGQIVRIANRFAIVSDFLTFLDNITLKLFGESQIIVVAQKPRKERK